MMNNVAYQKIAEKSYDSLVEKGYSPRYLDEGRVKFECKICGVMLSFYPIDEDVFGYGIEFKLREELTPHERERLERIYLNTDPMDVAFENLHIDATLVYLSSAYTYDIYPENMMELCIRAIESGEGIVRELKAKSYVWEEN